MGNSAMSVGVIEPVTNDRPRQAKPSAAKSWLKAIELTSRIEADPNRLFADIIEDHAARQPDRPCLLSETERFSYAELAQRINRYARWALSAGIEVRRHRLSFHARPAGLRRSVARHHQGRRRRGAHQHKIGRAVAVALHQCRGSRSRYPGVGSRRAYSRPPYRI